MLCVLPILKCHPLDKSCALCTRVEDLVRKNIAPRAQEPQTGPQVVTEMCGFATIVIGTFLLHATRDLDISLGAPPLLEG